MTNTTVINREYRDRLFKFIFGNSDKKEWTLSLYNALNGSQYSDANAIELNTIDSVVYMNMKNDVSFLIGDEMNLYEQQSTFNPNIPMRFLMYAGMLFSKYVQSNEDFNIYSGTLQKAPTPKCVCFYNGAVDKDDRTTLRLSDSFSGDSDIEVRVAMININFDRNKELLAACQPLWEYSLFVHRVRVNKDIMGDLEQAVDAALRELPEESLIKPYLVANKAEVKEMCLTEYEEERVLAGKFAEGVEKGIGIGVEKGIGIGVEKGIGIGVEKGIGIGVEKGIGIGRLNVIIELVKDGVLSVMEAARRADMTVSEFEAAAGLKGE